jgi:hypothetical protein
MGYVATQAIGQSTERVVAAAIGSIVGGWLLGAAVHRVSTRTGVWDVEAYGSLPGDDTGQDAATSADSRQLLAAGCQIAFPAAGTGRRHVRGGDVARDRQTC